jgi:CheY-like chemotaxis protein
MKSILVIDDNREIRENTAELLELSGYNALTAVNGKSGFDKTLKQHPDVVICDIMMPETNGFEFLKLIKNDDSTKDIPIIFFSAGSAPFEVKKGIISGADFYLSKPFTNEELMDAVETCLNRKG